MTISPSHLSCRMLVHAASFLSSEISFSGDGIVSGDLVATFAIFKSLVLLFLKKMDLPNMNPSLPWADPLKVSALHRKILVSVVEDANEAMSKRRDGRVNYKVTRCKVNYNKRRDGRVKS